MQRNLSKPNKSTEKTTYTQTYTDTHRRHRCAHTHFGKDPF